jgi:hypothetical protein
MGERKIVCSVLVVKPDGKRPLWRSWRKYEDNIKMDVKEIKWQRLDLVRLTQDTDQ